MATAALFACVGPSVIRARCNTTPNLNETAQHQWNRLPGLRARGTKRTFDGQGSVEQECGHRFATPRQCIKKLVRANEVTLGDLVLRGVVIGERHACPVDGVEPGAAGRVIDAL